MSKLIDTITALIGVGIIGLFSYYAIWPKIRDLKLPTPPLPQQQQQLPPQIIQIPSPTPTTPPPVKSQDEGFEKPEPEDEDEKKGVTPPKQPTATNSIPTPSPPSSPSGGGGALLWDSNTHGKWNSGTGKGLQKYGSSSPGGGGMMTAADDIRYFDLDGNGVMHLTSHRWGRVYIYAKNYNSRLEGSFMFETNHGEADNISIKMRSRHGHSGHTTAGGGSNEFGGVGFAFHPSGEVELAAEIVHSGASYDFGSLKGPPLQLGKWHKFAISVYDGGGINVKVDVDGQNIGTKKWANPHATAIDKAAFAADSYFWIRLNCHDGKGAKAAFNNLRLYDLGGGTPTNLMSSYYYNSFYNGRRL